MLMCCPSRECTYISCHVVLQACLELMTCSKDVTYIHVLVYNLPNYVRPNINNKVY